ncbi:PLP-dependent aminotransferase family protein [Cognatishimia sp.]|uniref:aminotransferase-like domain-containing protein n=1 Tax=Cognatishimia sp. TaxID=2211648 RepID=UPI0035191518
MTDTIWPPDFANISESKYIVLIQSLRAAVRSGELSVGFKLPPVRELAWQLGITPGTVARAYKMAVAEGLVETTVGRGTFVSEGERAEPVVEESLISVYQDTDLNMRGVKVPEVGQDASIRQIMRQLGGEIGQNYVDCPTPDSDLAARLAVVDWIDPDRVGRLSADDIVLGLGAQHSVIMTLQACLYGPNPVILTEDLGYPGIRHAARLLRAQAVGVKMDQDGMRPDLLEEALRQHGGQALVTVAETHSPTTIRASETRRQEIAEIARRYQLQIIEDDCYCVCRTDRPTYRAIVPERAWYVSSLTKSVSAAVRFGYVACATGKASVARQVAQSMFYGLPTPILDLCTELLTSGEAERLRRLTSSKTEELVKIAVNILGKWDIRWRKEVPFIWLRLPQGWRGSTFTAACAAEKIGIKSADEFALQDGQAPNAVRIGINPQIPQAEFERALRRMSEMLENPPNSVDV